VLSRGDWTVFVTEPISAVMLAIAAIALLLALSPAIKRSREAAMSGA
jgi:TctA family transporter